MTVVYVLLGLFVLLCLLYVLCLRCRRRKDWDRFRKWRFAHRGFHDKPRIPENSLPAFRRAVQCGFGAELDVHLMKDGHLAVIHDASLLRTAGADVLVEDLTAEELKNYRLEGTEHHIPLLEEVLPIFAGKAPLIVELKAERGNAEALAAACDDPSFFTRFARVAAQSENYGGNTREQGYTNMVDLGHLARLNSDYLTSAEDVLSALSSAVLYQVGGKYRTEATGLACYYSYNGDLDDLYGYAPVSAGSAFPYFFYYELLGSLDEGGMDYLAELDITELPARMTLGEMGWENTPLDVSDEGTAILTLGPEAENILTSIGFSLSCAIDDGTYMRLGTDNDMTADWENGVFYDNFRGVWGSIDGVLVYMELAFAGDDYNLYSVPVLINGEPWNLQVVYDFVMEDWTILGARQGVSASGMADKELLQLSEGDELTVLWYLAGEDGDFQPYEAGTVTVTADTAFAETQLPDGSYSMVFEMRDAAGGVVYSEPVTFDCEGGEIYTSVG